MAETYWRGEGVTQHPLAVDDDTALVPLAETDAIQESLYGHYMGVATYDDGSQAFVTFYSDGPGADAAGGDPTYAERAVAAAQFFENIGLGEMVPEHYYDQEDNYLAVAAVDGEEVAKEYKRAWSQPLDTGVTSAVDAFGNLHVQRVSEAARQRVDRDDYLTFAAAQLLSGNSDMKSENVMVDAAGDLYGIDLDHAGGDFTELAATADGATHYGRGLEYLRCNGELLGHDVSYSDIKRRAMELAGDVSLDAALTGIENSAVADDDMFRYRENLRRNITAFRENRFPDGPV